MLRWNGLRRSRLGLALGGGAARGLAHLGVLEVLEEHGLRPHVLAGTSIGALVAGIWCTSGSAESAIDKVQSFVRSQDYRRAELEYLSQARIGEPSGWASMIARSMRRGVFFTKTYRNLSFVSDENYKHNIHHLLPDVLLEDLAPPLVIVSADLRTGDPVVFRGGSLREAVVASGAVPGVMPPQPLDGRLLSDGALADKIPARALLKFAPDVILGVDVSTVLDPGLSFKRGLEVITRANQVTEWNLRHTRKSICDVCIRPVVQDIHWLDFSGAIPAIARGREAMEQALPELRAVLRRSRFPGPWGRTRARTAARLYRDGWFGKPFVEL